MEKKDIQYWLYTKKNRLLYIVKQQKINDIYIYIINEIVIRNKNKKCN